MSARLVQGNVACAAGAIAAGCRFYAGYPITPSSEIAEEMARRLPAVGGLFVQMEDEIASLAAVIGASLGGLRAMTATSGPGFSLMQEHLGFAAMAEVPCVVVNVMRGGPSTGLPTAPAQGDVMQARWGTHGDVPSLVLAPASVAEVYQFTIDAFGLAERFRTPVVVLYDEVIGHLREEAVLRPPDAARLPARRRPTGPPRAYRPYAPDPDGVPPLADFGSGYRFHVTGLAHDDCGFPTEDPAVVAAHQRRRLAKLAPVFDDVEPVEAYRTDDALVIVVGYGITGRAAEEAVDLARGAGIRAGALRLRVLWPFPERALRMAAASCDALVVAEMNLGQVVREVERVVCGAVPVVPCCRADGEPIAPEEILAAVQAALPVGRYA
ncbi:MAG: 2-oxoacid:acceptor oxidoreductase subunit alpha [Armatimonadota bacterium]|nr:2-oxoacid:acceptor oxidoreductase subunit alpha [Armatimonadota bacterium]MDR7486024.1 2-oxoacid:acceptor oxidoreductase subunit alpha [Armatimonadota bacterium]MDR7532595.1 2-oxoacid:acceptor oxidoreductase subunit alpha [Armatimonadota bacterium]MDR7536196.1 2-oxoacid:acceptor oxidoreductase subunit alpha [Armatimonadota bacterium]